MVSFSDDGQRAYVANGASGINIIDISNPESPSILGSFATTDAHAIVATSDGNIAYVADGAT
jgi:hypothetical protein